MDSSLTLVLPVFNQSHLTNNCLESVFNQSQLANKIIVINNGSTDSTKDLLESWKEKFVNRGWEFIILFNEKNVGFGRACNQGLRLASSKYVAVLSNDIWLMPKWDSALCDRLEKLSADMVGPYYDEEPFDSQTIFKKCEKFIHTNKGKYSSEWVSILMFFRKSALDKVGLFDERFFVTYEDRDLRERFDRAGLKYFKVADCFIWHKSKGTRDEPFHPKGYEAEGLKLFMDKWKFDPRPLDHTFLYKMKTRVRKFKRKLGYF